MLACWEIDRDVFRYVEAGRDEFGIPRPTFGRSVNVGHNLTKLPQAGRWPELSLVTSPTENDGAVLVLHPWACVTFFTAVPASWDPGDVKKRVEEEARLIAGNTDYLVEQEYVRSCVMGNERVDHLFVTCVPASIRELTHRLSHKSVQIRNSLSVVASLIMESPATDGLTLILGWYDRHLEVIVVQNREWLFGGYSPYRDPHDCLYYIASLLDKLGLNTLDLKEILQYGSSIEAAPNGSMTQLFATQPSVLRPASAFPDARETFLAQPAFVPCAGAVLMQLFAEV
ncbi:MAG: hypothetical protein WBW88_11865 [Rhodothermales bacterium]|jgi:hypothetical protein